MAIVMTNYAIIFGLMNSQECLCFHVCSGLTKNQFTPYFFWCWGPEHMALTWQASALTLSYTLSPRPISLCHCQHDYEQTPQSGE